MNTNERFFVLRSSPFFASVPDSDLTALSEALMVEAFAPGETVCEAGDAADRIFVIGKGTVTVHRDGETEAVRTMTAGALIGEYGMFTGRTRTATVRAQSELVLLSIDYDRFIEFLELFPQTAIALLRETARRLVALEAER